MMTSTWLRAAVVGITTPFHMSLTWSLPCVLVLIREGVAAIRLARLFAGLGKDAAAHPYYLHHYMTRVETSVSVVH